MKNQYSFRISGYLTWALCVYIFSGVLFLSSCGYDGTSNNNANDTSKTGSFACTLNWPDDIHVDEDTTPAIRALDCQAEGIDEVVFTFYRNGSWEDQSYFKCIEHYGLVKNLPVGSGYQVVITAEDVNGTVLYQGAYGPFSIAEGDTHSPPGGSIDMQPVVDDNYEDNDSIDAATPLAQDVLLSSIDGSGVAIYEDYDYYKIEVPYNSATIEINCTFFHEPGDIDIELFDAAGSWIDVGDQGLSGDDNETIVYDHASGASSTTYYIKVYLYDEGTTNTYDLIWDATPTAAGVNLTGMQYSGNSSFSVSPDLLVWGDSFNINWAITNNGTQAIPAGTYVDVDFFLSDDAIITEDDYWLDFESLDLIFYEGLGAGSGVFGTITVPLPISSPFSSSAGTFYIGMVIDVYDEVAETNENDNSGTGAGIDYASVTIAAPL